MNLNLKRTGCGSLTALFLILSQAGFAQEAQDSPTPQQEQASEEDEIPTTPQFGSPGSVPGQLADDARITTALTEFTFGQRYSDWKEALKKDHGLNFTVDFNSTVLSATNTLNNEDTFSGGVVRFFGQWDLTGGDSGNTGSFIWKVENRHRYSDIPPSGVKSEIGYIGLISPVFSNIQTRLTNLYWRQNLKGGDVEIIAGFIDTTDWIDVYILAPPWTSFTNFAFATGSATIAPPDEATLGAYVNAMITDNVYIVAGFADSNADSTDPFNGFDTFFNDHEFLKTFEIGYVTSRDRWYLDNTHITFWHADEREAAGVNSGWGVSFSFTRSFDEKWMPFLRGGYSEDGGTFLQKSLSTGFAYHWGTNNSLVGVGINWNEPNEDTFGPGLDDQYAIEVFSRLQITTEIQLSPVIHYIRDPALNPTADHSWVFGLRARIYF